MLIRLGEWSQLGSFTLTRTGRGQERAASPAFSRPPLPARANLRPPTATYGHGRRLFRGSAARPATAGCPGRRKQSGVAPSAGAGAGRELARAFRLFAAAGVSVVCPAPATDGQLETVHVQRYVAAVRQAGGHGPGPSALAFGLGTEDNPVFAGLPRRAGGCITR